MCPLAFRDVDDGGKHSPGTIARDRIQSDFHREFAAILPASAEVTARAHRPSFRRVHIGIAQLSMSLRFWTGHQNLDLPAQKLRTRITEQLLRARVDSAYDSLFIDHDNAVGRGFNEHAHIVLLCEHALHCGIEQCDDANVETAEKDK